MLHATFRIRLRLLVFGIILLIFFPACQSELVTPPPNESALITIEADTFSSTASRTPQSTTSTLTRAPLPTIVATPTKIPPLPQPTPTATSTSVIQASRVPISGWLVFSSRRQDTNGDQVVDDSDGVHLYSLDIDTQEVTQLTSGDQQDLYPDKATNFL